MYEIGKIYSAYGWIVFVKTHTISKYDIHRYVKKSAILQLLIFKDVNFPVPQIH